MGDTDDMHFKKKKNKRKISETTNHSLTLS